MKSLFLIILTHYIINTGFCQNQINKQEYFQGIKEITSQGSTVYVVINQQDSNSSVKKLLLANFFIFSTI
jgi:hypothetical protein